MALQFVERRLAWKDTCKEDFLTKVAGVSKNPFIAELQYVLVQELAPLMDNKQPNPNIPAFPEESEFTIKNEERPDKWTFKLYSYDPELSDVQVDKGGRNCVRLVEFTIKEGAEWFINEEYAVAYLRRITLYRGGPESYTRTVHDRDGNIKWVFRIGEADLAGKKIQDMAKVIHQHLAGVDPITYEYAANVYDMPNNQAEVEKFTEEIQRIFRGI